MQIALYLPNSFDAEISYDESARVITIKPLREHGTVQLIGVETTSDDGKKKERTMINFDLATGKPNIQTRRPAKAAASFDDTGTSNDKSS